MPTYTHDIQTHALSVGQVIYKLTNHVAVYVTLLLMLNDHHVGAVASYKYAHMDHVVRSLALFCILNLMFISDVKFNQVL